MIPKRLLSICLILLLISSSCGYRFGHSSLLEPYRTISIPYVKGDRDGDLTAAIIHEIGRNCPLKYDRYCGDLTLCAELIHLHEDNIGYRYEKKKDEEGLTHSVVPVETRMRANIEITLLETCSGSPVIGPIRLCAEVEFDHDYYSSYDSVNVFSLGQVSDIDEARDVVRGPLNREIARKVVDLITHAW